MSAHTLAIRSDLRLVIERHTAPRKRRVALRSMAIPVRDVRERDEPPVQNPPEPPPWRDLLTRRHAEALVEAIHAGMPSGGAFKYRYWRTVPEFCASMSCGTLEWIRTAYPGAALALHATNELLIRRICCEELD